MYGIFSASYRFVVLLCKSFETIAYQSSRLFHAGPSSFILPNKTFSMKSLLSLLVSSMLALGVYAQNCTAPFFSEYVEGSSNNKCLEIYNPTANQLSIAGYQVKMYLNGAVSAGVTITIPAGATIAPYDVYVICQSSSTLSVQPDLTNGSGWYNGDDAIELVTNTGTVLDVIGVVGTDPGTNWSVGSGSTLDNTLVRKANVSTGSLSWLTGGNQQWDTYSVNTATYLGAHTSDCFVPGPCTITSVSRQDNAGSCSNNGTPYVADDTYTTDITVEYTDKPGAGNLTLSIAGTIVASVAVSSVSASSHTFQDLVLPANGASLTVTAAFDDDAACVATVNLGSNQSPCSQLSACSYLFFSEYIEGTSNNKCIEIYNPSSSAINLAQYGVFMSFNGGTFVNTIPLNGSIEPGGTYVICNSSAWVEFRSKADQVSPDLTFNGNDVVILQDGNGIIDAIGQLGNATNFGIDVTLRRKFGVTAGDNNPSDAFSSAAEWDSYPVNTFWGLGYHSSSCNQGLSDGLAPFVVGNCNAGSVTDLPDGDLLITNSCAPPAIGDGVTMAFPNQTICNLDLSAQVSIVSGFGNAGLMYRANMGNGSPYVYIFTVGNDRVYFATRRTQNGIPQVNFLPAFNVNYLRLVRVGNVYRGMSSVNGQTWNMLFQVNMNIGNCGFAGPAVQGTNVNSTTQAIFGNLSYGLQMIQAQPSVARATDQLSGRLAVEGELMTAAQQLEVSPNPATDWIRINLPAALTGEGELQLRDLAGRVVIRKNIELSQSQDLVLPSAMPSGVYILSINTGGEIVSTKVIKQ
jgi:hypothetical protein